MGRENPFPYLRRVHWRPRPPACTVVFLHIPKTAGKSLRQVLLSRIGRHSYFSVARPVEDYRRLEVLHREDRAALALVEGHLYYGIHEILPLPCVYLTMLRDPVERVLSYYSYIRGSPEHHLYGRARDMSLGRCLQERLTVELDNFMVRCLTSLANIHVPFGGVTRGMLSQAKSHLDAIGPGVGLTERFDESVARFGQRLGWPRVRAPRVNTTPARVQRASLSPDELDLVEGSNALDRELYEHARGIFEAAAQSGPANANG